MSEAWPENVTEFFAELDRRIENPDTPARGERLARMRPVLRRMAERDPEEFERKLERAWEAIKG